MTYDPTSLTPVRVVVFDGKTTAYGNTGLEVAAWGRELTQAEVDAYLTFPGQVFTPAQQPRPMPIRGEMTVALPRTRPMAKLVTHADGGQYIHLGTAHGAGKSRNAPPIEVYRSVEDGRLWFRDPADFAERMTP